MIFRAQFLSESPPPSSIYTQLTATHTPPTDIWEGFLGLRKKERNPSYIKAKSHLTNVPLFPFRIRVNELIRQTFCTWEHAFSFLDLPGWVFILLLSQTETVLAQICLAQKCELRKNSIHFIILSKVFFADLAWLSAESCPSTHVLQHFVRNYVMNWSWPTSFKVSFFKFTNV